MYSVYIIYMYVAVYACACILYSLCICIMYMYHSVLYYINNMYYNII